MYVINRSYGKYSAGTRVDAGDVNPTSGFCCVCPMTELKDRNMGASFDIEAEYITKLRPRTMLVPTINSKMRRAAKRREMQVLKGLIQA